jgi:hypothetical protein
MGRAAKWSCSRCPLGARATAHDPDKLGPHYASFAMLRARYDWGGGAIESSVAYGHGARVSLGYRLRLSDHWLLVSDVRGRRSG